MDKLRAAKAEFDKVFAGLDLAATQNEILDAIVAVTEAMERIDDAIDGIVRVED